MNKNLKKTVSVAVASAIVMSMSGCALFDKSKEEVLDAAESYAKELAACNIDKIAKLSNDDFEDIQEEWAEILEFTEGDLYTEDTAIVLNAIAGTISYEIDEESVEATKKSGEGSIDVVFTIADYGSLDVEEFQEATEFADAVADADTTDIKVTLEFERTDDGEWLGSNYSKVFDKLYSFTDEEFTFRTPLADLLTDTSLSWYFVDSWEGDTPVYINADTIDGELNIDLSSDPDISELYVELTLNGQVVAYMYGDYDCWISNYEVSDEFLNENGDFIEGTYTITFYEYEGGDVLVAESCTVRVEEDEPAPEPTPATPSGEGESAIQYLTGSGDPFYDGTSSAYWYESDEYSCYPAGTSYIELTIQRYDDTLGDVDYVYGYSADGSTDSLVELGTFSSSAVAYNDGDFYECGYSGTLESGYYICLVSYNGTEVVAAVTYVG